MNEKQIKIISLLGKVGGLAAAGAAKAEFLPPKFMWIGVVIALVASAAKDAAMYLGDLWDDGKLNQSYKP